MEEQKGEKKAEYGAFLITELSKRLTKEFGKGFPVSNLKDYRQFYLTFSGFEKSRTVCGFFQSVDNQNDEKGSAVRSFSDVDPNANIILPFRKELTWSHYRLIMRLDSSKARQYYMDEAANHNWSVRVLQRSIRHISA